MTNILLGSHVSMSGKEMLLGAAKEAKSYEANTFMIYTGAPQNTRRKKIEEMNIEKGLEYIKNNNFGEYIAHAPYIINLGNTIKPENFGFATQFLREEIQRCEALGVKQITMHPGAHVGAGVEQGINQIIKGLNEVLTGKEKIQIALETMAGKGTELGRNFEELAMIINGVKHNDKLSITLDTCHTHDAGYNIKEDFDGVLNNFDKIIGLDRLKVLHINDSKNIQGAGKDRHANIGHGYIGFEALHYVVHHKQLQKLPKILETPYIVIDKEKKQSYAPYKQEIEMLKTRKFNPNIFPELTESILF